jgi:hypothetical protein
MRGANRVDAACRGDDWHESTPFACLGFEFAIRTNDARLAGRVTDLYAACRAHGSVPRHSFILRRRAAGSSSVTVYRDGRAVRHGATSDLAVSHLAWEVNRAAVEHGNGRLLLHAAAAERDGRVLLLAGPAGAGKSTLVAALVATGLRYVTDEVVAIHGKTGVIEPYPKPIGLHRRVITSGSVLADPLHGALREEGDELLVPPHSIRANAVAPTGGLVHLVLFPRYVPGAPTVMVPTPRSQALVAIVEQAFNFRELSPGALDLLARVVRGSHCYRLEFGDLAAARDMALDLFASVAPPA